MRGQRRAEPRASDRGTVDGEARQSALATLAQEISAIKHEVAEIRQLLQHQPIEKNWYSTAELAAAMEVSQHTVMERWCNQGRIKAEKDGVTGKWRIPGNEFRRLVRGGALRPRRG